MRRLELLSPARDADTAIAAIRHGADAVYIGAPAFGARAAATNSIEDIARVVEEAKPFGAKVYVTLNTIIYNDEIEQARELVTELWDIGVDALIVQDMALLEMDIPPIDLHASTQTDARDIDKIKMLAKAGFSQIVVPREFSLKDIEAAVDAVPEADIEVFVHGALCVCYSGDCHAGAMLTGRSANRGECPQVCRLRFNLTDGAGNPIKNISDGASRHWLSTADMCRIDSLKALIEAGASSFKIEGRLKPVSYVKNVTAAYSEALDRIVRESDGKYRRASFGKVTTTFTPKLDRTFNRGYTPYFLTSKDMTHVTSWKTPKWIGRPVARVTAVQGKRIEIESDEPIANGDGLGFFKSDGNFSGFRVNRSDGKYIFAAPDSEISVTAGTQLYRNYDMAWENRINRDDSAKRTIAVDMTLRRLPDGRIAIDASDERGCAISVCSDEIFSDEARSPQAEQRQSILGRLGDTMYHLNSLSDLCGNLFIPSKSLAALRRNAIAALDRAWNLRYRRRQRRESVLPDDALRNQIITYHGNVANKAAEKFYLSHGAKIKERAVEVMRPKGDVRVMTTRYCLRRELGACLKTDFASKLPDDLWLDAPIGRLQLKFDCERCNMHVILPNDSKQHK